MRKRILFIISIIIIFSFSSFPTFAYSSSIDVDGDGKIDGTLSDEVTCFVVVPSTLRIGDNTQKVYIAGRAYASATLSIPTSAVLSDGKGNNLTVQLAFGSGSNSLDLVYSGAENRVVSTNIVSKFETEPKCGTWTGHTVYMLSSKYQNPYEELVFTLSSDGTYYIVGTGSTTSSNGLVKKKKATGKVLIPETYNGKPVKEIGPYAFSESGITSLYMPSGIIKVGNRACDSCLNLSEITFSSNISTIGNYAFSNTTSFNDAITLPLPLNSIGQGAFYKSGISSVIIQKNLLNISTHCFSNNYNLTYVSIPSSMKTINSYAFVNTSITSVTIPKTCSYNSSNSFPKGCTVTKF
ncbi:MAG: leucine-rich repeat domain-containing protein [Oscillospiraceae bacterium]|nr:leucine-rich repeat domain-containing protein [Oscillospiraceae bacterium]